MDETHILLLTITNPRGGGTQEELLLEKKMLYLGFHLGFEWFILTMGRSAVGVFCSGHQWTMNSM